MYKFIDTVPAKKQKKQLMSIQTVFNGVNLDDVLTDERGHFKTLTITGRANVQQRIQTTEVPGRDGLIEQDNAEMDAREISVKYKIKAKSNEELRDKYNELNNYLEGSKKELIFTDENAMFYATMQEHDVPEEETNELEGTIIFLCTDPYKYIPEETQYFPSDHVIVTNDSNAPAAPIFEMQVLAPITFAMIQKGNLEENDEVPYQMIGAPADDDIEAVDTRNSVLYENGSTLEQWTPAPLSMINDPNVSNVDGVMGTDGAGIRADNYGTVGTGQRGPAIYTELPDAIQDFEIETTFDIISRRESENFRIMVYFYDEAMNDLGQMGLKDNTRHYKRRRPLAKAGGHDESGGRVLGDADWTNDNARNTTLFYLRAKREGNLFSFYVGEWQSQRHINVWEGTYRDVDNNWGGKLKYIALFIGSYQDRGTPSRTRINSVEVFELLTVEEDNTPYIAYPGDVITFDHVTDELLINGEDRSDIKDFGAGFFELDKGHNEIFVLPSEALETSVSFRKKQR